MGGAEDAAVAQAPPVGLRSDDDDVEDRLLVRKTDPTLELVDAALHGVLPERFLARKCSIGPSRVIDDGEDLVVVRCVARKDLDADHIDRLPGRGGREAIGIVEAVAHPQVHGEHAAA